MSRGWRGLVSGLKVRLLCLLLQGGLRLAVREANRLRYRGRCHLCRARFEVGGGEVSCGIRATTARATCPECGAVGVDVIEVRRWKALQRQRLTAELSRKRKARD